MKIYVAGPMSKMPNQNREAFISACDQIRDLGHEAVNPIEVANERWPEVVRMADYHGENFLSFPEYQWLIDAMLTVVDECDAIFMLPGWGDSRGAKKEHDRAKRSHKPIFHSIDEIGGGLMKWTGPEEFGPSRQYTGDAGFDLWVAEPKRIHVQKDADVPCGISVEMPPGVWGMVIGRSSTMRRRKLLVNTAVIDNGYRGPLFAYVRNVGEEIVDLEVGERIAQLLPFSQVSAQITPHRVAELADSDRGQSAFGSTGR